MGKKVKLSDIASRFGVSNVTVSKALSGQKGVSEEMRAKIIQVADELGYKQPSAIRKEMNSTSFNIAVLIHDRYFDKYDSFYLQVYQLLTTEAMKLGCFVMLEIIDVEMEQNYVMPKVLSEEKADGIIVLGRMAEYYLDFLNEHSNRPVVYMDFCNQRQNVDAVISDSFYGSYYLTNYLFEMGHEKIAFVGTVLETSSITDRYLGYVKSMMEHGKDIPKEYLIPDRPKNDKNMYTPSQLVLPHKMPTAFVCNCDLSASILIKRLRYEGYRVPEDISVVGYDNYLYPGLCDINLTTYEVDTIEMANKAIDLLRKKINKESYKSGINVVEGKLILGESVKDLVY